MMQARSIMVAAFTIAAAVHAVAGEGNMPKIGEKAPEFTLPDHQRNEVSLASFRGKQHVVLAFYPLAFTGG